MLGAPVCGSLAPISRGHSYAAVGTGPIAPGSYREFPKVWLIIAACRCRPGPGMGNLLGWGASLATILALPSALLWRHHGPWDRSDES